MRTIEAELQALDSKRSDLEDALHSLSRLVAEASGDTPLRLAAPPGDSGDFPGTTAAVLRLVRAGGGRPVSTPAIRRAFEERGWMITAAGQDRTHSIYETLRRLTRAGRLVRRGKHGYVLAEQEPPGDPRKGDLLGLPRPEMADS